MKQVKETRVQYLDIRKAHMAAIDSGWEALYTGR